MESFPANEKSKRLFINNDNGRIHSTTVAVERKAGFSPRGRSDVYQALEKQAQPAAEKIASKAGSRASLHPVTDG
jgi:hypothetical protein